MLLSDVFSHLSLSDIKRQYKREFIESMDEENIDPYQSIVIRVEVRDIDHSVSTESSKFIYRKRYKFTIMKNLTIYEDEL